MENGKRRRRERARSFCFSFLKFQLIDFLQMDIPHALRINLGLVYGSMPFIKKTHELLPLFYFQSVMLSFYISFAIQVK